VSSPVSALLSWLLMAGLALVVGFASLAWPDDDAWDRFEAALLARTGPAPADPVRSAAGGTPLEAKADETDAVADTDGTAAADTEGDTDGEPLDSPIPVERIDFPDPESLLDELPAEGPAPKKRSGKIVVGDARVEVVDGEGDWLVHEVTPTETPDQIAHRYGVRPDALRMWNGIKAETEKLRVGTRLKLHPRKVPPPRQKHEYWVQPGDTWWSIGTMFGIDSRDLRATNSSTPQRLVAGMPLEIWLDPIVYMWVSGETDAHVPVSVRLGAVGIGTPQAGRLVNGVQLPLHEAYSLKLPPSAYGTTHAVAHVVKAMDEFRRRSDYRSPLMMGSMSAKHGGLLSGHKSHQSGRDLDIRLPLLETLQQHIPVTAKRVDWVALWHLIEAFDATGQVVIIFLDYEMQELLHGAAVEQGVTEARLDQVLQYPHGNKANLGLVRHSPGHLAHIHVRMTCGPSEPECVSEADFDIDAD
jgi:murein endopeptidase